MSESDLNESPPPPPPGLPTTSESHIPAPPPPLPSAHNAYQNTSNEGIETPKSSASSMTPPVNAMPSPAKAPISLESQFLRDEENVEPAVHDSPDVSLGLSEDISTASVLKEGWLLKKAGPLGIARKRYCVLYSNGVLRYYTEASKSEESRKGKGDVNFRTIKSTSHDDKKFTIENDLKVWNFEADDFIEAADWISKFEIPSRNHTNIVRTGTRYSMSTSMTLEAYGEDERETAQRLHTM